MIGLNEELAARQAQGKPVKIGLIGAGQMGVDVVAQVKMMKGIDVIVIADINLERAKNAYKIGQVKGKVVEATTVLEADLAVSSVERVFTNDYRVVTDMNQVDVMLEATGVPEVGAKVLRPVKIDTPITYDDVEIFEPSTVLALRRLQDDWMAVKISEETLLQSVDRIANR